MKFIYQARNSKGEVKRGFVVAASEEKAEQLLSENNFVIIGLEVVKENFLDKLNPFGKHVGYKDLVLFSRQLATLISARVPILQALRILENQIDNQQLGSVLRELISSVENGESFSLALSKHPEVFGNVYVSLVKSGESSGSVAKSLEYLADQLEKDYELRGKVRSALTYPAFVLSALVIVGLLMFKFVLPKLTSVLEEQGGTLPTISVILINLTHFIDHFWWLVILAIAGLILGVRYGISTLAGRYFWDRSKVHLPILGPIFSRIYMARFSRNLATLISGGIPIISALQIVSEVMNNVVFRDILIEAASKVTGGTSISDALVQHREFPVLVTQMVKVGEQSAQLDDILAKLANFYEKEVDNKIAILAQLLEPIVMVLLGLGVGALVAGILLPIYNLASTVS